MTFAASRPFGRLTAKLVVALSMVLFVASAGLPAGLCAPALAYSDIEQIVDLVDSDAAVLPKLELKQRDREAALGPSADEDPKLAVALVPVRREAVSNAGPSWRDTRPSAYLSERTSVPRAPPLNS